MLLISEILLFFFTFFKNLVDTLFLSLPNISHTTQQKMRSLPPSEYIWKLATSVTFAFASASISGLYMAMTSWLVFLLHLPLFTFHHSLFKTYQKEGSFENRNQIIPPFFFQDHSLISHPSQSKNQTLPKVNNTFPLWFSNLDAHYNFLASYQNTWILEPYPRDCDLIWMRWSLVVGLL